MKEIITVNGQQYDIETTSLSPLTQEQRNEVVRKLGGTPTQGCTSCSGNNKPTSSIASLATGCPTSPIPIGTTKQFTINSATGIGPFYFTLIIGGVRQPQQGPVTTFPYTMTGGYTFNTAGSFATQVEVKDSCTGSTSIGSDACASSIVVQSRCLNSLTLSGCVASIAATQTCQLTPSGLDQFGSAFTPTGVTYSSSNTAVATVNPSTGLVTGVGVGTATITASTLTGTCTGTVSASTPVTVTCPTPTCAFTVS